MNTVYDKTWDLFMAASMSDDDLGYPDEVEFIPGDQEWADDVLGAVSPKVARPF